ncbi:DNA mismatch repair protein MSH1, mitochondrial isoform X2 [Canna indica]|uniref:DNA mismatch repair protein MSH1, mitochondrial isoform X2 n=1 Tax=Canna indica TaxID=4628 RepID=A0AAQ3KJM7_9LILI|nr:DNA mismatch repair protein MSH1, mitochondrial isoform X2 [Canna indica]
MGLPLRIGLPLRSDWNQVLSRLMIWLAGFVSAHRSKEGMQDASLIYVIVPGKSIASQLETLLINQLRVDGFRLVNKADGRHRNFGIAGLSTEALTMCQQNNSS